LLENKIACCNRACKSSDDFEIVFQLFQEYAGSVGFGLCFQDFGQELKFHICKITAPQLCIFLRGTDQSVYAEQLCVREDIRYLNLNVIM